MQTEVDSSLLVLPSLTSFSLVNVALPVCSFIRQVQQILSLVRNLNEADL